MAQGVGEKGLADADGPDDGDVSVRVEEAQRRELVEGLAIKGHCRGGVPGVSAHRGIQARRLDAHGDGQAVAAGDFIAEDLQQEVLLRHLVLARQRESLGQRIEHARQLEPPQDGFQIRADHIGRRH